MRLSPSLGPLFAAIVALTAAVTSGCGSSSDEPATAAAPPNPFQEVVDRGLGKYVGKAKVVATDATSQPGVVTYEFDPASGPRCLSGDPYRMSVRDRGSDDLFLFLQGGGACWSTYCLAITKAPPGIPKLDVLDPDKPTNPVRDLTTVYLPYCDGSMFAGDAESDSDHDGKIDRWQHGLQNLSAAIDVAYAAKAAPKRVVLAGSSGGGYGTILAALLVRTRWPSAELLVIDDAGIGLGKPGDASFIDAIVDELAIRPLLPASCPDCTANGHITRMVAWELAHDPKLRISAFSSYGDQVISDVFLGIDAATFEQALRAETGALHDATPDRYRRFLVKGRMHTTLLGTIDGIIGTDFTAVKLPPGAAAKLAGLQIGSIDGTTVGGVSVATWVGAMLRNEPAWDDRLE